MGNEINALSRCRLLRSTPRWREAIIRVIHNNRKQKREICFSLVLKCRQITVLKQTKDLLDRLLIVHHVNEYWYESKTEMPVFCVQSNILFWLLLNTRRP